MDQRRYCIGIDMGGTSVKLGLLDAQILSEGPNSLSLIPPFRPIGVLPTPSLEIEAQCARFGQDLAVMAGLHAIDVAEVAGVGLAVPGAVDAQGELRLAPNVDLDLDAFLCALRLAFPGATVACLNDANAAALGEWWHLNTSHNEQAPQSMMLATLGTGIGAGLVLDGHIVTGAHGGAGEIGHLCVEPGGRPCNCGLSGCLEQYCAARGIVATYREERMKQALPVETLQASGVKAATMAKGVLDVVAQKLAAAEGGVANSSGVAGAAASAAASLSATAQAAAESASEANANVNAPVLPPSIALANDGDAGAVFRAAIEGDDCAVAAVARFAQTLGTALAQVACVVNPEVIVLGGGISASADLYLSAVQQAFDRAAVAACAGTVIREAALGNEAGMMGAAHFALERHNEERRALGLRYGLGFNPGQERSAAGVVRSMASKSWMDRAEPAGATDASAQAKTVVVQLTDQQKVSLLVGSSFWYTAGVEDAGLAPQMLTDGPHGLRKQKGATDHLGLNNSVPATCFPTASALACSFDIDLLRQVGQALGEECRKEDVSVLLGPGVNIKRSPLCGRNFEYFSEDPLLAGSLAAAYIQGVQSQGVGTSLKHFAANSQEKARMVSDSVVDERTLNEVYLRPFELAVRKAQPWTVMTAYNRLNGTYCSENGALLQGKLRGEWGFQGACVTDWGALSEHVESFENGLDLCMPGPRKDVVESLNAACADGSLSAEVLNRAAENVAALALKHDSSRSQAFDCNMVEHLRLARRAASSSAVLLENNGTLPLQPKASVAVIGSFAKKPRYQGAGSSKINPVELDDAWSGLLEAGVRATYAVGYESETGETTVELLNRAEEVARKADVAIVFAGLPDSFESEGYDRTSMAMPVGHSVLIEHVCAANPNTVVVLCGGAPFEMPWRHKPAAILMMYLAGCQGGGAAADVLLGRVSPSGRLAETWPEHLADTPLGSKYPDQDREILYTEGPYVGYRYYDAADVEVAYPFGYGLSYTTFVYDDGHVEREGAQLVACCTVRNVGSRDADEVVQVYTAPQNPATYCVPQALAGFAKVSVPAGSQREVRIPLDGHALGRWDNRTGWCVDAGTYEIRFAASSRDVRAACELVLAAGEVVAGCPGELDATGTAQVVLPVCEAVSATPARRAALQPYFEVEPAGFTREAFEALYGRPLPERPPLRPYTPNTVLGDLDDNFIGRRVIRGIDWYTKAPFGPGDESMKAMMSSMMTDAPLRLVLTGGMEPNLLQGFINAINGHYVKAIRQFRKKK